MSDETPTSIPAGSKAVSGNSQPVPVSRPVGLPEAGRARHGQAPRSGFISYCHRQQSWVVEYLKPCLEAGGARVLIDIEHFRAGVRVIGQMDALQDTADVHVLVLSGDYLKSKYCLHEMKRALAQDPGFREGKVLLVRRDDYPWPAALKAGEPLYVDLRDDADAAAWDLLLQGCGADLGCLAPGWLRARDEVIQILKRKESVNLVVGGSVKWLPLIEHIRQKAFPDLKMIDLEDAATASRRGLLSRILREFGLQVTLPGKPEDLVEFDRALEPLPYGRIAITHFQHVVPRHDEYGIDLFAALRNLIMYPRKKLGLLIQSRQPLAALLPRNYTPSWIDAKTVELKGRL